MAVNPKSTLLIDGVSIGVVILVGALLAMPNKLDLGEWTAALPHVIGLTNSFTVAALLLGLYFIKSGKISAHRSAMMTAFGLGVIFLISYIIYHLTNSANKLGADGAIKVVYLLILGTHILLSLVVLPLVLRAMYFAITNQIEKHKKIVRFSYPIWLYVSISGVAVYLLVNQFFPAG